MEKSESRPNFRKQEQDGERPSNKPLQLRKKDADGNFERKSYTSSNYGDRKPYGNNDRKPYGGNNDRRPYNNDRKPYGRGDGERRPYDGNSERKPYGGGDRKPFNSYEKRPYGNRGENRPYNSNRTNDGQRRYGDNQGYRPRSNNYGQDNQGETVRYDDNNKKIVFRKRKNISDGTERKSFVAYREEVDLTKPVRLNKFLANSGTCSRREADEYIQAGVISVNGEIVTELGTKILPTDKVMFHNETVRSERKIYLLLNKPKDCVTTVEDTQERKTVMDMVKNACSERIYPVGRLDRNTTGVLLLTNDGDLASQLTHPKFEKKKIYHVTLDRDFENEDFEKLLNEGVELEDGIIKADDLAYIKEDSKNQVGIEIHSGKNRVIRRLFDSLGYKVKGLDRVYFAGLTKKNLPRGKYRFLTGKEISMLKMGAYK
ncbi:pseudouridine synthase [Paludibacter sp. 221]|uniref:pseudouridine synthase n=1 Tax=Paludibacter sp. 221 TaxID=2302939 RepID=UPI0013D64618|nr:pseudouridine synthase [Paludibacter sp. 221]NDV46213.1 pseudouridine synthase [Paludibacter sp. 221]